MQRCTRGSFGDFIVLTAVSWTADSTFIGCEGSYIYRKDQIRPLDCGGVGELQCMINGNCAKFVGRALRDGALQKKIAVSKFFTYCDSIILPLFSSENQFTSLLRSQHLGYLPCRFAARRLGHPVVHPVRSLAHPVGQPAPGHRISPSPC